jgi:hypothetical protein
MQENDHRAARIGRIAAAAVEISDGTVRKIRNLDLHQPPA